MPKITPAEYDSLKAFFDAWQERFRPSVAMPSEYQPVAMLEFLEKKSMAKARLGLGLAIGDILEMSWHCAPALVAEIDRDFAARGILTLSELRRRYSRQFRGVLKRGKIRNQEEYYLVAGILASFTTEATEEQRGRLETMAAVYEKAAAKKSA